MTEAPVPAAMLALDVFVGQWHMEAGLAPEGAAAPRAHTTFEWLAGQRFLIQRWEVDHPDAPDGIALIGFDEASGAYQQHYFDSRGVVRRYDMTFADGVWTLERRGTAPDFSQRFSGTFSHDGDAIVGRWDICTDGANWSPDFALTYHRVR